MPLPVIVKGASLALGARKLYKAGKAGVSAIKKFDSQNKFITRPMKAATIYAAVDPDNTLPKINNNNSSKINSDTSASTDFSRKLIK